MLLLDESEDAVDKKDSSRKEKIDRYEDIAQDLEAWEAEVLSAIPLVHLGNFLTSESVLHSDDDYSPLRKASRSVHLPISLLLEGGHEMEFKDKMIYIVLLS